MSLKRLESDLYVPITISEDALQEGALQLLSVLRPAWETQAITFKMFTDGITNKLICCMHHGSLQPEDVVVVRVYGHMTDLLIDRTAELRNMNVLYDTGITPRLIGAFQNGLAMEFITGDTLTTDTVRDPKIYNLIARTMAQMHKIDIGPEIPKQPMLWDKIEQFLALLPEPYTDPQKQEKFVKEFGTATKLRIEYERLKLHLMTVQCPIVFAHNDLLLGNVIYNDKIGKVTFIDYEYAMYNYQPFDIANHFAEFVGLTEIDYSNYPSRELQLSWLSIYLEEYTGQTPSSESVEHLYIQVNQFLLAAHFLWGVWGLVQAELSYIDFDYAEFAAVRFREYHRLKDAVYQQLSICRCK